MRIALGADHAGYQLKDELVRRLRARGDAVLDQGTRGPDAVDYPDLARAVCEAVTQGESELGIMICGTGIGSQIACNKMPDIRAALCHDTYSAICSREHNDANVLCLGARVIGVELAWHIAQTWLQAGFSGADRHRRRIRKVMALEELREPGPKPSAPQA